MDKDNDYTVSSPSSLFFFYSEKLKAPPVCLWSRITIFRHITNLGYIALNKVMLIIHDQMFEIFRGKHLPFPCVAQTGLV